MTDNIQVDNLKCGGCEQTIQKTLHKMHGVQKVVINNEAKNVSITHDETVTHTMLANALKAIGYPEAGTTEGLDKTLTNVKSYISCAIGRLSDAKTEEN